MVEEMVTTHGWPLLLDRARYTMLQKQTRIVQGKCDDHEDYVKECSFLEGMDFVMSLPARLQAELELHLDNLPRAEDDEDFYQDGGDDAEG